MITDELKHISQRIVEALSPCKIYLFGSYAKDTYTENSDYDIYVICPDGAGDAISLSQRGYRALRGIRKKPVDLLIGFESKFKERENLPTIEQEVKRTGVLLYEK